MEQEIIVKISLPPEYKVDNKVLLDIFNGLNDRYIPVDEILVNGEKRFSGKDGFTRPNKQLNNIKEDKDDTKTNEGNNS